MPSETLTTLISGGFFLFVLAAWVILTVMLIVAPLMIWRWTRRTCEAAEKLTDTLSALRKSLATMNSQQVSELRLIREAVHPPHPHHRPVPPTIPPAEALAVCPECGAVSEFDAKASEVDVTCPSCGKAFHIH